MSLLDDARRLIEPAVEGAYVYCGGRVAEGHRMPCDLAAVPSIVAVLEAAERLMAGARDWPTDEGWYDIDDDDLSVLEAALKGDKELIP